MKLIIQIPCYNEAETLEIALNDLPKHIDGIDEIEYLIINDGSKDNTVEVAKKWGVHYVVNFKQNKGLAKGFMAGVSECLRQGADIIVNTDADNQYCGEDIEKLVRPILDGKADIVIGERPIDQPCLADKQGSSQKTVIHFTFNTHNLFHMKSRCNSTGSLFLFRRIHGFLKSFVSQFDIHITRICCKCRRNCIALAGIICIYKKQIVCLRHICSLQ